MVGTTAGTLAPTRRTLVRGAAWTVPVIAAAATAPAFAASPIVCPVVPASSQWTATTVTGSPANKNDTFSWDTAQEKWIIFKDASTSGSATFSSQSPSFAVRAGSTIQASFTLWWGYGNSNASTSFAGTFQVLINGTVVKTIVTRTAGAGPIGTYNTQTFSYTVPAGVTTAVVTYRYTAPITTAQMNADDDIVATRLSFGTCTVN